MQYELKVENGQTIKEEGSFFPAIPFKVEFPGRTVEIRFIHTSDHNVVYEVKEGGSVTGQLEHPDYTPDKDPADASASELALTAALIRLNIAKGKVYEAATKEVLGSYTVTQETFL